MTAAGTLQQLAAACKALPLPPAGAQGAVFAEPWQAHAFAMALQLHERGLFTWVEWAAALSAEIAADPLAADDDGSRYYQHWLNALEQLVIDKQIGTPEQIHDLEHAWEAAVARTPHGQPIELAPGDTQ